MPYAVSLTQRPSPLRVGMHVSHGLDDKPTAVGLVMPYSGASSRMPTRAVSRQTRMRKVSRRTHQRSPVAPHPSVGGPAGPERVPRLARTPSFWREATVRRSRRLFARSKRTQAAGFSSSKTYQHAAWMTGAKRSTERVRDGLHQLDRQSPGRMNAHGRVRRPNAPSRRSSLKTRPTGPPERVIRIGTRGCKVLNQMPDSPPSRCREDRTAWRRSA
jgi:hypothetical protein